MRKAKLIGVIVLVLLGLILMLQNTKAVETRILFMTVEMPRALLLLVTLAIGFGAGLITAGIISVKRNK